MDLPLIIFDEECPLCVRFTQALRLVDKNKTIHYVSAYHRELYKKYPFLNQEECLEVIHMIDEQGHVLRGGQVVQELIKHIPAVEKFGWLIDNDKAQKASDAFYKKINEIRKRVKKKGCAGCGSSRRKDL